MTEQKTLGYHLDAIDDRTLKAIRERFQGLNHERLARLLDSLGQTQRDVYNVLPVLLHMNHPDLPGYISEQVPSGIQQYSPRRDQIFSAQELVRAFSFFGVKIKKFDLVGVYLMSPWASSVFTNELPLHFWIFHDPSLATEAVEQLRAKLGLIRDWAATLRVALEFSLINPAMLGKTSEDATLPPDRLHSTARLDQLYRSGVHIAGRMPLWWLVPPALNARHAEVVAALKGREVLGDNLFYDFGPLSPLTLPGIGADALMNILQGLERPELFIPQLLLAEIYADGLPDAEPLAATFKHLVYIGKYAPESIDPLVMLLDRGTEYLTQRSDTRRLELLRRCVFFSMYEAPTGKAQKPWRQTLLEQIQKSWGYSVDKLRHLELRRRWTINQLKVDKTEMFFELSYFYRLITAQAAREGIDVALSPEETSLVGRKLQAYADRKAGKIELLDPFRQLKLTRQTVSFHYALDGANSVWLLFEGHVHGSEVKKVEPLKRTKSVVELIAWASFNRIINVKSDIYVEAKGCDVTAHDVKRLVEHTLQGYPQGLPLIRDEAYQQPAVATSITLFVNIGTDPTKEITRDGNVIITEQSDPLAYGAMRQSLVRAIDMILTNSWGEVFAMHHEGPSALVDTVLTCLRFTSMDSTIDMPTLKVVCESIARPEQIMQRVDETVREIINTYRGSTRFSALQRYILEIEQQAYVFEIREGQPQAKTPANTAELVGLLAEPRPGYSAVTIDREALKKNPLREVARLGAPARLQVFYAKSGDMANVYVRDEFGCVFHCQRPFYDEPTLLKPIHSFLVSIANRRQETNPLLRTSLSAPIYQEIIVTLNDMRTERRNIPANTPVLPFYNVEAIAERLPGGGMGYRIYCGAEEFSQIEYGDRFFAAVADHIASNRPSGVRYPVYITDMDLSAVVGTVARPLSTCDYLRHKERLELAINNALDSNWVTAGSGI